MARLCAVADGNNTSSSTWALIDSTSYNESETNVVSIPTTYPTNYAQFTPGAITIDGIGFRLNQRSGTTGTFSIELYNHTAVASVAGTEVTINCSDFSAAVTSNLDGGWYFFKFGSSVTLIAGNAYSVRAKTSSASQISSYGSSSLNPSRFLRTTTTQAPAAGDNRIVVGEWTAAGSMTTRTVTLDDTSTVDYGAASNSTITPALSIGRGGIVEAGTSSSTTYVQKISGNVVIYNGGELKVASSGSRMPSTSSFTWTFDIATNVEYGITVRNGGSFKTYGVDKTRWTTLTADEAAGQTVIGVADTTGWADNDSITFASTNTPGSLQTEDKVISTVDSSTQITITTGLNAAKQGSGDVIGEVSNNTCNVEFVGVSTTLAFYVHCLAESDIVFDNTGFRYIGSNTSGKNGVTSAHTTSSTNTFTVDKCVFRDLFSNSSVIVGTISTATSGGNLYITNSVLRAGGNCGGFQINTNSATADYQLTGNLCIGGTSGVGLTISGFTGASSSIANNITVGFISGISITRSGEVNVYTTIDDCIFRSATNGVIMSSNACYKIFNNCSMIRNTYGASGIQGVTVFNNCNFYSNANAGIVATTGGGGTTGEVTVNDCTFRGDTSYAAISGIYFASDFAGPVSWIFNNCSFGTTTAHTSADILVSGKTASRVTFNSCTFASTTEVTAGVHSYIVEGYYFAFQRKDNTDGNHIMYVNSGIITPDTTIYKTASPSIRVTPTSGTYETNTTTFPFSVFVNNGEIATVSIYVRESDSGDGADYAGDRVKLYVKANPNLGITSDTLLDTATASSDGAWEELTGTTAAVGDDGVLEFYLTCKGTSGWINYDDITITTS